MQCFNNLVGIRSNCGDTEPESGRYIQDLPLITLKNVDAAITSQNSAKDLLQTIISRASIYMYEDIINRMSPYYRSTSVIEQRDMGYYNKDMQSIAGSSGYLKGVEVKITKYPYLVFHISQISLFTDYSGDVDLLVYDLQQNKLLDTITVTAVADEITLVDVNKSYPTNKQALDLFIGYNSTGINSYKTNLYTLAHSGCRTCSGGGYGSQYCWFYPRKIQASKSKINYNLESSGDSAGLSLTYSLQCTLEPFICSIKNRLSLPLMYRAGMEILNELKASDRLSSVVVFQRKEIDEFYQYFESQYSMTLANVFSNMRLPSDICFERVRTFGSSTILP